MTTARTRPPLTRALLPAAILIVAALATATAALFVARTVTREEPPPPYVSGQSSNFLNRNEALSHLRGYLATTLWAETAYVTALDTPSSLPKALHAPLPLACTQPDAVPNSAPANFLTCATQAAMASTDPPPWPSLPLNSREAAATTMLSNLWRATDPVEEMRLAILWREGVDPTDAEPIQKLQLAFDHCPEAMMARRHELTGAKDHADIAIAWLSIADELAECADITATRLFTDKPPPQGE